MKFVNAGTHTLISITLLSAKYSLTLPRNLLHYSGLVFARGSARVGHTHVQ